MKLTRKCKWHSVIKVVTYVGSGQCTAHLQSSFSFSFPAPPVVESRSCNTPPSRDHGASLTAVVLVRLVAAVVNPVTVQELRQTLGHVPTGEETKRAHDFLSTPTSDCDEKRRGAEA